MCACSVYKADERGAAVHNCAISRAKSDEGAPVENKLVYAELSSSSSSYTSFSSYIFLGFLGAPRWPREKSDARPRRRNFVVPVIVAQ